ncbi:MAG: HAD family hydrolase [Succinivibrionaceae bacterium]
MALVFFDLDGTLIKGDSNSLFFKCLVKHSLMDKSFLDLDQKLLENFYAGTLDIRSYYEFILQPLQNKTIKDLEMALTDYYTNFIPPYLYQDGINLIKKHQQNKDKVIIVSATLDLLVENIALKCLGADGYISTRVEYSHKGKITGKVYPDICHQIGKAHRIKQYCQTNNLDLSDSISYGDTINDIPMLECTSKAIATNPQSNLKSIALKNGWEILNFEK